MNILYIFVEIIKKSTTMKNLIFTLILALSNLVVSSQVFNITSNFSYYVEYEKGQNLDSLIKTDTYVAYGTSDNKINFKFNLDNGILTVSYNYNDSLVVNHLKIVEVLSFQTDNEFLTCNVIGKDNILYTMSFMFKNDGNKMESTFLYKYGDDKFRAVLHPEMTLSFED